MAHSPQQTDKDQLSHKFIISLNDDDGLEMYVMQHGIVINSQVMKSCHLLHVDVEGSLRLALGTRAGLHLLSLGLEKRPQHKAALVAVVLDHAELRENASAAADHTTGPDQLVEVELPGAHRA